MINQQHRSIYIIMYRLIKIKRIRFSRGNLADLVRVAHSWPEGFESFQPQTRAGTTPGCFFHPAWPPAPPAPPPARQPPRGHTLLAAARPVAQSAVRAAVACRDAARWVFGHGRAVSPRRPRASRCGAAFARVAAVSLGHARRCCLPVWGAVWGRGRRLWLFDCRWPGARVCLWHRA